jgi:hypothetical protein
MTTQELIESAFADVPYPGGDNRTDHQNCPECDAQMTPMKKETFRELQKSMEQALAHAQGNVTLRTKQVPVPKKVASLPPAAIQRLRERLTQK